MFVVGGVGLLVMVIAEAIPELSAIAQKEIEKANLINLVSFSSTQHFNRRKNYRNEPQVLSGVVGKARLQSLANL
jgi:hypothetical protein